MKTIIIDDKEYCIVDTIIIDDTEYTYFINTNDETDFFFKKTTIKNEEKYYSPLKDKNEFEKVLLSFAKKYNE